MANLYTCKCGAPLEVSADGKTGTCPYCGDTVVFPKAGFQRMNKANELRRRREFDQAEGIYRSLTIAFPDDPEVWWNIVLCEYGIEYVEETREGARKMVPTINRMKYESIFEQDAYKKAISLADSDTRGVYEAEARKIEDIQIRLQQIVAKEDKYDIFISFKDKDDETGERTLDSALAQEIYDALTKEGYKVFFSRITLRRAIGQEFEPKIFAALNSASMMLVVTCKKEHTEATWVKNEWSRYLKLMEKDANKYLLPIYADIKPEELPDRIASMEGIEVNGANYMNLILKNVGERIGYKKEQHINEQIVHDVALLEQDEVRRITERGYNAIQTGRMTQAEEYFEQALDINVAYAPAWWGKLSILTVDFQKECDIFADAEMKRYYDEAKRNATEEEWSRFQKDLERFEQKQREYRGQHLMEEFMERTNNMRLVYSDGNEEEDKIQEELVVMENEILELCEEEKRAELKESFDAYNHKQARVRDLKKEYLKIEAHNQNLRNRRVNVGNKWHADQDLLRKSAELYGVKIRWAGTIFFGVNGLALLGEGNLLPLIIGLVFAFFLFKQYKNRDAYCGGSCAKLRKQIEEEHKELQMLLQKGQERVSELTPLYTNLQEKYIDVKGYVIPNDIPAHVNQWREMLCK